MLDDREVRVDMTEQGGGPEPRCRWMRMTHLPTGVYAEVGGCYGKIELTQRVLSYLEELVEAHLRKQTEDV